MTRDVTGAGARGGAVAGSGSHIESEDFRARQGAARGAKGPDELRRQIEQTRHELGDTVEQLAGKMDVKGRALARAEELRDKAGAMTVQLRSNAAGAGQAGLRYRRPVLIVGVAAGMVAAAGVVLRQRGALMPPAGRHTGRSVRHYARRYARRYAGRNAGRSTLSRRLHSLT
ncbi:DUF3618 domain-containing protein [Streptomyces sp. GD-15H]|uniref:DUF3618 domain-containing protein n=1 Tax=Streptomyces sp. GD-15H TaxID=3129112 RepID=UPI00324F1922